MPDYRLQLLIDPTDLSVIRTAGQRITLAKPVNSDSSPNVIWLSIDPFQSTEVQWSEEYGIYASTTAVQQGASITKLSETGVPAQDGASYSFTSAATFNGPFSSGSVARGSYGAQNDMPNSNYPMLTFGLTQSALINQKPAERKPISATPVLATQFANMTPFSTVYIWLQSQFSSETIITKITGKTSKARFGGGVNDLSLKYDANLGVFVPVSAQGKALADHPNVELSTPLLF
ncbi:MAG: hypothetical protein BGP24_12550 [Lysobacterales bacterium 69-70]|nr:hypothetical protein [Xanthomonadaceae bacterium]ODU31025.1 MAG: hypothetical protein ABS97_22310 [Xanthomonadaceae bacterium SCN 69-320]OJY98613.1 MAG: hypothetical protein BGP24_12550 [Xanthomonadales bacterium 69-70]